MNMPAPTQIPHACQRIDGVLTAIGDKWSLPVMMMLEGRAMRFNELKRAIKGISHQMLTRTVRALERDGMISRTVYPTTPPQVEYDLTPLGRSLFHSAAVLGDWALEHVEEIEGNRDRHDASAQR